MDSPAACQRLASDVPGAEGPVTDAEGRLWFVAPSIGEVRALDGDGVQRTVANTGGAPAGLHRNARGEIWIADMRRGILRLSNDGQVVAEITEFDGGPIRGCNDLCFDSEGNLYFTAPAGSSADKPVGEIFCRLADGEVRRLDAGFAFCNGLALSADGRGLFVAETFTRSIWRYDLAGPGRVAGRSQFAVLPGEHRVGPDGMDFDGDGNLVATNDGEGTLDVFVSDGRLARRIFLPFRKVSNLHFAKPGSTRLILTEHENNAVWATDYGTPGQLQPGWGGWNLL